MEQIKELTPSLEENINILTGLFKGDQTVKVRRFENQKQGKLKCCLFFVDGMINNTIINQHIIQPIIENERISRRSQNILEELMEQVIMANEISVNGDLSEMIAGLLYGDVLLLVEGESRCLVISAKGWDTRGIAEPDGEKVMRGPREGFNENLLANLALLRRKVCSPDLKYKFMQFGRKSNTKACLCYIGDIADPALVNNIEERLSSIDIDAVLSVNYIAELIQHTILSPFKITGSTERPDTVAGKILEGRIALIIDGTPVALVIPHLFLENFQSLEDYYLNFYYATLNRILRFAGFLITTCLPATYLALMTFHQELMPTKFLVNISQTREGLPFTTLGEMLILLIIFELIREGGSKIPSTIGQSLSIVGGLVLGQAAVSAKFVSVPIVIIVAITGITSMMIPYLSGPSLLIRFGLLFLAYFSGLFGMLLGAAFVIFHLCSLECFGIPYMSALTHSWRQMFQDTFMRTNWKFMKYRPRHLAPKNKSRQASLLLLFLILPLLLSGCDTGMREVNNLAVLAGVGIDKNAGKSGDELYTITAEILNLAGEDKEPEGIRIKSSGSTLPEAIFGCNIAGNRTVYWQHSKLIIISRHLAETDGVSEILDLILRNYSAKLSSYIVLSDISPAEDIFALQTQATNIKSFDISVSVDTSADVGNAFKAKAYQMINTLKMDGVNIIMPLVGKTKTGDNERAVLTGTAMFKGDKLAGTLSIQETPFLLLLRDDLDTAYLTIQFDEINRNNYALSDNGKHNLAIQIKNAHTDFIAKPDGAQFGLTANVKLSAQIVGSSLPVDMNDPVEKKQIEALVNAYFDKNCSDVIQKVKELHTDVFGFGSRIKKDFPVEWNNRVTDWDTQGFGALDVTVNAYSDLTSYKNMGGGVRN